MYLKRKYQLGGVSYTPFIPTAAAQSVSASSSSSSSSKTPIRNEMMNLLKQKGIPSDVEVFLQQADRLLSNSMNLSNYSLFGGSDDDYSMSDLIQIENLANQVNYNNDLKNNAISHINKEGTGSELALSSSGEIYAFNKDGKLDTISAKKYHDEYDK